MNSPIKWYGGKTFLLKHLLPKIPQHHTYVEVFGGAAQLLFAKEPSPVEVYNDIDNRLTTFFRVLQEPAKHIEFQRRIAYTLYSRREYKEATQRIKQQEYDDIQLAVDLYIAIRQGISGHLFHGWSYDITQDRNMPTTFIKYVWLLPLIYDRLRRIHVENDDFRKIIPRYDSENTFYYIDPPYPNETVKLKNGYEYMMSLEDHEQLIDLLLRIRGKALVSCYSHPIYERLTENGWNREEVERQLAAKVSHGGKRERQREVIWWNYYIEPTHENTLDEYIGE